MLGQYYVPPYSETALDFLRAVLFGKKKVRNFLNLPLNIRIKGQFEDGDDSTL